MASGPNTTFLDADPFLTNKSRKSAGTGILKSSKPTTTKRATFAAGNGKSRSIMEWFGLVALPWLVFVIVELSLAVGYSHYGSIVILLVVGTGLACSGASLGVYWTQGRIPWYGIVSFMIFVNVVLGTVGGIAADHAVFSSYFAYSTKRVYTNVLPSQSAAAHTDAGVISFARSARVDTTKALGRRKGSMYCVAPILDELSTSRAEFWAVGTDCCNARGGFLCGDVMDPAARSGIVLVSDTSAFTTHTTGGGPSPTTAPDDTSEQSQFEQAARQAQAVYNLASPEHPVFVRWVSNPVEAEGILLQRGYAFLFLSIVVMLVVDVAMGAMLHVMSPRGRDKQNLGSRESLKESNV